MSKAIYFPNGISGELIAEKATKEVNETMFKMVKMSGLYFYTKTGCEAFIKRSLKLAAEYRKKKK